MPKVQWEVSCLRGFEFGAEPHRASRENPPTLASAAPPCLGDRVAGALSDGRRSAPGTLISMQVSRRAAI